ncbi:hypothetical protein LCGC14_1149620 [marine sediment metagenome]|uniref:JAB domain-containing protein n=1 Tax=marine sediment metagenome TaxID=412755 RepID=A0A0F9M0X5_9ZZZZ
MIEILPFTAKFHDCDDFREQIAVLYLDSIQNETVRFVRSWIRVCQPGMASFDPINPGAGGSAGWNWLDDKIENRGVRGVFHTHPLGVENFSGHDVVSQIALAKTYGKKMLWHGVQAYDCEYAHFKCMYMINGQIFVYEYDPILSDPNDMIIILQAPILLDHAGNIHMIYGG